ncbi:MAG: hypothetical protein CME67_04645 [Halobacteriovoraceae bacterium]|nr:hypothetical protein [Halobacteriovoraceae bacterium]|tara:strand:- start:982 stop:1851 length:870 start_codon:yes stop_codon:yes gene_type:complete
MYDYKKAFERNLGWVTPEEQEKIKTTRIAVIGMGGVGGHHAHCLARMGFSQFKISDFDTFEIQNFNRQFGALSSTVGKKKTDVIKNTILDINPEASVECFDEGINESNMEEFLRGVDVICDGLDLYASHLRSPLYELAHKMGVYIVSAGPFGMGTSCIVINPKGMSFNEYFDLNHPNLTVEAKIIRFLAGMAPTMMHRKYIADPERVQLFEGTLPSIQPGCYAASAALGTVVLKLALGRGKVLFAPTTYHTDLYLNKAKKSWLPFGNRNPLQKIKIKILHRMFKVKVFK